MARCTANILTPKSFPQEQRENSPCLRQAKINGLCTQHARMAERQPASPAEDGAPRCESKAEGGYRCELPAIHTGEHRAFIDAHDEQGPIPELRWLSELAGEG